MFSGIKNIRFPPSAAKSQPTPPVQKAVSPQDDDVIFISPPTSPVPSPLPQNSSSVGSINSINLPSSVSLIKKSLNTPNTNSITPKSNTIASSAKSIENSNTERPKTFLRVKSLLALQNVTSECITIPDDPLPPPPPLTPIQINEKCASIVKSDIQHTVAKTADIVEIIDEHKDDDRPHTDEIKSVVKEINKDNEEKDPISSEQCITFKLNEPHSDPLKKIINGLKIVVKKSVEIDELARNYVVQLNSDQSN